MAGRMLHWVLLLSIFSNCACKLRTHSQIPSHRQPCTRTQKHVLYPCLNEAWKHIHILSMPRGRLKTDMTPGTKDNDFPIIILLLINFVWISGLHLVVSSLFLTLLRSDQAVVWRPWTVPGDCTRFSRHRPMPSLSCFSGPNSSS